MTAAIDETDTVAIAKSRLSNKSVAAYIASSCGVFAGFPFDSLKTRMQTHTYPTLSACMRDTFTHEGIFGFYRGVSAPLLTTPILKSCSFTVYEYSKRKFQASSSTYAAPTSDEILQQQLPISLHFLSGVLGGMSIAVLSSPLDLLKIQFQLHGLATRELGSIGTTVSPPTTAPPTTSNASQILSKIRDTVAERGFLSVYRGVWAALIRESLGFGTYFAGYELICRRLSPTGLKSDVSSGTHFMAGGISGILIWVNISSYRNSPFFISL